MVLPNRAPMVTTLDGSPVLDPHWGRPVDQLDMVLCKPVRIVFRYLPRGTTRSHLGGSLALFSRCFRLLIVSKDPFEGT